MTSGRERGSEEGEDVKKLVILQFEVVASKFYTGL